MCIVRHLFGSSEQIICLHADACYSGLSQTFRSAVVTLRQFFVFDSNILASLGFSLFFPVARKAASLFGFIDHTQLDIHTHTVGLLQMSDQLVADAGTYTTNRRDEHLYCHRALNPVIPSVERPQTYGLDRMATEIGLFYLSSQYYW